MARRKRASSANQDDPDQHVTRPGDEELIYHRNLHRAGEGTLCHYLGLSNKGALRRLRLCHVVVRAWTYLKPMLVDKYSKVDDIYKVFDLFVRKETEDEFEATLGTTFTWESHCQVFMPNGALIIEDSEEVRIKHLASVLVTLKHSLAISLDVENDLEDLSAQARHVFESSSKDNRNMLGDVNYRVPVIPYTSDEKICLIAPDCDEHPFEQYQRLYIILRHTDVMLSASKWSSSTYDVKQSRFREYKWRKTQNGIPKSYQIKPEDMPLWMRPTVQPVQDLDALAAAEKTVESYRISFAPDSISGYTGHRLRVAPHLENIGRRLPEDLYININLSVVPSSQELHDYLCRQLRLPELALTLDRVFLLDTDLQFKGAVLDEIWKKKMLIWPRDIAKSWVRVEQLIEKSDLKTMTILYTLNVDKRIIDEVNYPWETDEQGIFPADYFTIRNNGRVDKGQIY